MGRVQQVECLYANLELHLSRQAEDLEKRNVLVSIAGAEDDVAPGIADDKVFPAAVESACTGGTENALVLNHSCDRTVRNGSTAHEIGPQSRIIRVVAAAHHVDRLAGLQRRNAVQLPAADHRLCRRYSRGEETAFHDQMEAR